MNNIIGIIVSFIFTFSIIGISTILTTHNVISGEDSRKFVHIGVSNWWIIAMIFFNNPFYATSLTFQPHNLIC
jgi:phytol kinase